MKENIINIFDTYLRNELPDTDRQQFEKMLENDPVIKTAFEEHKNVIEEINQNARQETLKMIHVVQNEFLSKKNSHLSKLINFRRFISIAAIFIIILGFGFGVYYFSKNPGKQNSEIADNQTSPDVEPKFGGSPDRNLIFKKIIPVVDIDTGSMVISDVKKYITVKVYENKKYNGFYSFTDNELTIFLSQFNDLDIKVVRLKNYEKRLYLKFGLNRQWYFCETLAKSKKLSLLSDDILVKKLNQIPE